jgi:hypothetical protein
MCNFPSWIKADGKVYFLTDKDLVHFNKENESDAVGHYGLRTVYPGLIGKEGKGFPCPPEIVTEINRGNMARLMKLGGYKWVSVNARGKLHRTDGPALEYADGSEEWYLDGKRHRSDGPAVECADGSKLWYLDGKLHRTDGPAVECADGSKFWYLDGKLHRTDGPAAEYADGGKLWYLDGKLQKSEDEND